MFRKNWLSVHVSDQFGWIVFLLSSTLNLLVNSYVIDGTCQHYGETNSDITNDIQQAINEVQDMARNAYQRSLTRDASTIDLLRCLFGVDRETHPLVSLYFDALANPLDSHDFVVICDDLMMTLEPDNSNPSDPRGMWKDYVHEWMAPYDKFFPCDPSRKPSAESRPILPKSYTINGRFIVICPVTLNNPKGRSLLPYKNQDLTGEFIDSFELLPAALFYELLRSRIVSRQFKSSSHHDIRSLYN